MRAASQGGAAFLVKGDCLSTPTAQQFRAALAEIGRELSQVSPRLAELPWREKGWNRKQMVGHLLDSAANNRQRFARAAIDGAYIGPFYAQDAWVNLHGYATQSWETLLRWWQAEHEILISLVDRIPAHRLDVQCTVGDDPPVTLQFLIEDYVAHQRHHLRHIQSSQA